MPTLAWCYDAPLPPVGEPEGWEHLVNDLITLAAPEHSSQDTLSTDAAPSWIHGKFAYGLVNKDLQGERVEFWIDDCSGAYARLGEAETDSDGKAELQVPEGALPIPGSFAVLMRVVGDQSEVRSTLSIYPVGTELIVTDVDGTLTTSDGELFSELFDGSYVPESRDHALELMALRAAQGYPLVYLTGRPYWLDRITRGWLVDEGYPVGTLHLAPTNGDVLPQDDGVGAYKAEWLRSLLDQGFVLSGAYGNASTDIYGYENAPVSKDRTWIAGELGGEGGTVAVGEDWVAHTAAAAIEPDPVQPFTR
ncbi:MAG: hypothetical protein JXX28_08465 [Deltaproteobacteria bacterium]|nr:hypothetical protein [Deltaproteobacteria bacterium]